MKIKAAEGYVISSRKIVFLKVCPVFHRDCRLRKFSLFHEVWVELENKSRHLIRSFTNSYDAQNFKKYLEGVI